MAIPDPLIMLRTYLLTVSAIATAVANRIYNEELPAAEASLMPRPAIVLSAAGGPGSDWLRTLETRVDVRCYGAKPIDARALAFLLYDTLAWASPRDMGSGRAYKVEPETMPLSLRDPDTDWPFATTSYLVTTSREPAA